MIKIRAVLRRRWKLLVFGLVVGVVAGAVSSALAPESDEVSYKVSQLIVANRAAGTQGLVEQDALRVTRGEVAKKAAAELGIDDPQKATKKIAAKADTDSGSIEVTAVNADRKVATKRANAFVDAFLSVVNADLLADQQSRFSELQSQIDDATEALAQFDEQNPNLTLEAVGGDEVMLQQLTGQRRDLESQVDSSKDQLRQQRVDAKSTLPYSTLGSDAPKVVNTDLLPVPTGMPFRMGLLGLVGLALAIGAVMVIERIAPRIDTRAELVAVADYPVLSEVGNFPSKSQPHETDGGLALDGAWAEPYRRIRSAIQFVQSRAAASDDGSVPHSFLITSPSPGDGKSTTAAVTGLALAETGQLTLVIGGDFRRPKVHELLGASTHPGIRDYAQIAMERPTASQVVQPTSHPNLHVASAGASSKEIAGLADATREIVAQAVDQGATVIMDSSPLEVANDTLDLLPAADSVIVLVRSGHTAVRTLEHSLELLNQHGASIMGMVLIGTPGLSKRQYYYEGYYTASGPTDGPWPLPLTPSDEGSDGVVGSVPQTRPGREESGQITEPTAARTAAKRPDSTAPRWTDRSAPPPFEQRDLPGNAPQSDPSNADTGHSSGGYRYAADSGSQGPDDRSTPGWSPEVGHARSSGGLDEPPRW